MLSQLIDTATSASKDTHVILAQALTEGYEERGMGRSEKA